jgi:hypothetical protein
VVTAVALALLVGSLTSAARAATNASVWAVAGTGQELGSLRSDHSPAGRHDGVQFVAVRLHVGRSPGRVFLTNAATPAELLSALGIRLLRSDRVTPSRSTPLYDGISVRVTSPGARHGLETGQVTWYQHSGLCGASHALPRGVPVTVSDAQGRTSVTVIIDDRGPRAGPGRFLDLCQTAFARIAPLARGVARVTVGW